MTSSFFPPQRTLLGPGPSDVAPRVLAAVGRPTIGHLDPLFINLMDEIKSLLQYAFGTENELTLPISAPGSAGMESCFVNLLSPGDTVIVCQNGVFGGRMKENVERCGATAVMVEDTWGEPVSVAKVAQALAANPQACTLAFVHAETSTGVRSDAQALCALAREHDALVIMDTVTSLAEMPVLRARYFAGHLQPPRRRAHHGAGAQGAELVPGYATGDGVLGRREQARLPPHRTGERPVRPPRDPGDVA